MLTRSIIRLGKGNDRFIIISPEQLAFFQPSEPEALKPSFKNSVQRSHFSKAKSAAKVLSSRSALKSSKFTREQLKKMVISHLKEGCEK